MSVRGQFGDQFGALNAFLSGLSFIALIFALALQGKDLRAQTRALELQQEALIQQIGEFQEQKEEMRRSAQAQEDANAIQKFAFQVEVEKLRAQYLFTRSELAPDSFGRTRNLEKSNQVIDKLQELIDGFEKK